MSSTRDHDRDREIASRVREACIQEALTAYEDAAIRGLCGEGAFEAAVSAMRMLDLDRTVDALQAGRDGPQPRGPENTAGTDEGGAQC